MHNPPLRLILLLAFIHGLAYLLAVPPWQHYDEPAHFDYVWRLAQEPVMPSKSSSNGPLHLEIARSMLAHGFYRAGLPKPDLTQPDVSIGVNQLGTTPVYYWLAGLPLRLASVFGFTDVTALLYVSRGLSLALFVLTVALAGAAMREVFPAGHAARWLVPALFALLPSASDLMTAVNDDVIAILFGTLFLWASARLIKRGLSLDRALLLLSVLVAGLMARRAIAPLLGAFPVVVLLAWARGRRWAIALIGGGLGFVLAAFLAFALRADGAQTWVLDEPTVPCAQAGCPQALGQRALHLLIPANANSALFPLWQLIDETQRAKLSQATVTFGAWMWTDDASAHSSGQLSVAGPGGYASGPLIPLSQQPTFHAVTLTLPANLDSAYVQIFALSDLTPNPRHVYFDGFVLTGGALPLDVAPTYSDASLAGGTWAGQAFTNLMRNPSAEASAWMVDTQVDRRTRWLLQDITLNQIVYALQDPQACAYYALTAEHWLQTFWGRFGWGNVPLTQGWVYVALLALTGAGLGAALVQAATHFRQVQWDLVLAWGLGAGLLGFAAFTRGVSSLFVGLWLPGWRYMAPANLVVLTVLALGWRAIGGWLLAGLPWPGLRQRGALIPLILLLGFDAYALYSQFAFYISS